MPRCRNAGSSFTERGAESQSLWFGRTRTHPWSRTGLGVTAAHQLDEFLRCRVVAAVAALLRHRATISGPLDLGSVGSFEPLFRRIVGPGLVANIDTAHDDNPLPNFKSQRTATAKGCMRFVWVGRGATSVQVRRAGQGAFSTRERLKKSPRRTRCRYFPLLRAADCDPRCPIHWPAREQPSAERQAGCHRLSRSPGRRSGQRH